MTDNPETNALLADGVLGKQVSDFLDCDVGRFLTANIDREYADGIEALKLADPDEPNDVRAAQNKVYRAEKLREWLTDAIRAGLKAVAVLEYRQDEDSQ